METNPIVPRQRNRRADRNAATEQAAHSPVPVQSAPSQPPVRAQQVIPAQPSVSGMHSSAVQPLQPQTPRTMYQQQPAAHPVRTVEASYPQMQRAYPQQNPAPIRPAQSPQPPVQHSAPQRPRTPVQTSQIQSGWQQPSLVNAPGTAHVQPPHLSNAAETETAVKPTLPGWITTALSLALILVLALGAAYWLLQAYLTTQENNRIAAYEAVLENHHVTRAADGTLRVSWQDSIEKYAAQYNLQPAFVIAIIRHESSFRTNAESNVGARGLMQLMPDTAEWIAGKLDDDRYTFDSMWDADTNIRYGCWYLGYLSRLFRGDAVLVSAAYHAGQSTITQWLSNPERSSDGVTLDLDRLSDGPTKQYIGRVTQTYGIYQTLLYPDEAFGAQVNVSAGSADAASSQR